MTSTANSNCAASGLFLRSAAIAEGPGQAEAPVGPVVEVLGIRHHGPGSARAVRAALDRLRPDVVLIEGPADASPLTSFVSSADLVPPVALLAYVAGTPSIAAFWPFAVFSPEWQALCWAADRRVPVRFCDLPSTAMLASSTAALPSNDGDKPPSAPDDGDDSDEPDVRDEVRRDPIAALASAAGYDDPERWWDDVVESRLDAPTPFPVITEAMTELRAAAPKATRREQEREDRREAFMRQSIRGALRDGAARVAVVCGAWHAPALTGAAGTAGAAGAAGAPSAKRVSAAADAATLRGMPKVKTAITWVPWTASRLSYASGYGAGIDSPGWYHHLFTAPDRVVVRWLTKVAGVLRQEDLPVSSAHVIEAVRLAETLASMRGRPLAGLDEVMQATRAVMCNGDDTSLALVTGRLVVGEAMGRIPESVPAVPLETDLQAAARKVKLKRDPLVRTLSLDLRKDTDLARSRLLHRLSFLGIPWGAPGQNTSGTTGTFRETWSVKWRPELAIDVVEASIWGSTLAAAAAAKAVAQGTTATLPELTRLVEHALLADLPDALAGLLDSLDERAAHDLDIEHLMTALLPLVRAQRYSDVRGTDSGQLARVTGALLIRICAAMPAAVTGLDDEAARALRTHIDDVHAAVQLGDDPPAIDRWMDTLARLAERTDIAGVLTGRMTRLLRDAARISTAEAAVRLGRTLSIGTPAAAKAGWVEGFLDGAGLILVHDRDLLALLDQWVAGLSAEDFTDVLPLLRRTFGAFSEPERRALGEAARRGPGARKQEQVTGRGFDEQQALPAVATVTRILGGGTA